MISNARDMVLLNETLLLLSTPSANFSCIDYLDSAHHSNTTPSCISNKGASENGMSESNVVVIIIYAIVFAFGTAGNSMVISYFGFKVEKRLLFHNYLIHLAVSDFIASTITPIHFVYDILSNHVWYLGHAACTIIGAIGPLTVNVSAWLLASIAHERYWGIAKPMKPRFSSRRIHITAGTIWVASLLVMLPYMESMHLSESRICAPDRRNSYYELGIAVIILVLQSVLPTIFMVYAFACILKALKRRPADHMMSKSDRPALSRGVRRRLSFSGSRNLRIPRTSAHSARKASADLLPLSVRQRTDTGSSVSTSDVATSSLSHASSECGGAFAKASEAIALVGKNVVNYPQNSLKADHCHQSKQKSCVLMLIVTFLVFVTCSLPYNLFYVVVIVIVKVMNDYSHLETLKELNLWLSMLVVSNSITNCFIYAGMDNGFRAYCKRLIFRTKKSRHSRGNREVDHGFTRASSFRN